MSKIIIVLPLNHGLIPYCWCFGLWTVLHADKNARKKFCMLWAGGKNCPLIIKGLSTIQKAHKSAFPLNETRSPTGGCPQIQLLQYTLYLSTISLSTKSPYSSGHFKKTSLQGIFMSWIQGTLKVSVALLQVWLNKDLVILILKPSSPYITEKQIGYLPVSDFSSLLLTSLLLNESHQYRIPARSYTTKIWHWTCDQTSGVWVVTCSMSESKQTPPMWTRAYNGTGFVNAKKGLWRWLLWILHWNFLRHFGFSPNRCYKNPGSKGFASNNKNQVWSPTTTPTSTYWEDKGSSDTWC
jgi:hypothetical protein